MPPAFTTVTAHTKQGPRRRHNLRDGNFGLGTVNGLDGEMLVLDASATNYGGDGNVRPAEPDQRTPRPGQPPCRVRGSVHSLADRAGSDDHRRAGRLQPQHRVVRRNSGLGAEEQIQTGEGVTDHDQHHGELAGELMARGQ
ncbi:acetolactate decarboxylase [Mycobacterium sp.]|uniref:acetolactate decarboxylase n=1 Tax=Mycobacterium sp. TaxID=1785 RepID=UPI003D0A9E78